MTRKTDKQIAARERKQLERMRREKAGLIRVEVYVKPEHRSQIHDLARRLLETGAVESKV